MPNDVSIPQNGNLSDSTPVLQSREDVGPLDMIGCVKQPLLSFSTTVRQPIRLSMTTGRRYWSPLNATRTKVLQRLSHPNVLPGTMIAVLLENGSCFFIPTVSSSYFSTSPAVPSQQYLKCEQCTSCPIPFHCCVLRCLAVASSPLIVIGPGVKVQDPQQLRSSPALPANFAEIVSLAHEHPCAGINRPCP